MHAALRALRGIRADADLDASDRASGVRDLPGIAAVRREHERLMWNRDGDLPFRDVTRIKR
jgi:hypothetical protein